MLWACQAQRRIAQPQLRIVESGLGCQGKPAGAQVWKRNWTLERSGFGAEYCGIRTNRPTINHEPDQPVFHALHALGLCLYAALPQPRLAETEKRLGMKENNTSLRDGGVCS
jgi:hypothetical protein